MRRSPESLVADIADDRSVDWRALDAAAQPSDLQRQFRIIAAIGAGRDGSARPARIYRLSRVVVASAAAVAAVKIVAAVLAIVTTTPFRIGPQGLLSCAFGILGATLVLGGRRDDRAGTLGFLFVLIGGTFTHAYLLREIEAGHRVVIWLLQAAPESFLALALWLFAWVFPAGPRSPRAVRAGALGLHASLGLGTVLVAANLLNVLLRPTELELVRDGLMAVGRAVPGRVYWPLLLTCGGCALPFLLWKSLAGTVEDRSRAGFLAGAVLFSLGPMVVAVLATAVVPGLARVETQAAMAGWLYLLMGSLVPATVYAVAVRKVVGVHLVVRRAVQHVVARRVVWTMAFGSLAYVGFALYAERARPLGDVLSGQGGLLVATALGLVAVTFRAQLLQAVDRWFERGPADYSEVMTRLAASLGRHRDARDLQRELKAELARTLNPRHLAVLLANDDTSSFVDLDGGTPPLPASSAIGGLFAGTHAELCLGGDDADPLFHLLPRADREWLAAAGAHWVFPLVDSSDTVVGLVCLGEPHGAAYSRRDRVLVSAVADQVALRIENLSLRHGGSRHHTEGRTMAVDWRNERAMQCPACDHVRPADESMCPCGGKLVPATVPLVLNGKFAIERVLGSGGMSVVYLALDTALGRRVAVKAMPLATPRHVARLRLEARAMALVLHPNLAMIYGVERWRDVPLLVVEYLDGGTLLDGLRAGPLSIDDALDLGILLSDGLDRMHAGGLLHRDIKPSNIGYTGDGVPKLLDFGLAALLGADSGESEVWPATAAPARADSHAWPEGTTRTLTQQLVGTPLYLSPEALAGHEPEPSFDLWSLGLVLYEAVAGRHPFAGYPAVEAMRRTRSVRIPDVRDSRRDCPAALAAFLNDALSLAAERRPPAAADFRMQLQAIREAVSTPSSKISHQPVY